MATSTRQRRPSETAPRPFWRRHFFKLTLLPLGLTIALWFLVIQPRTSKTVNEEFPTAVPRATTVIAATTAPTVAPTATSAPIAASVAPTATPSPVTTAAPTVTALPAATVNAAPTAAPTLVPSSAPTATTAPAGPVLVKSGAFVAVEHDGSGTATIFKLPDGAYVLRLEDLSITNGPDLRVRLLGPNGASLDLGGLKGNKGNQNYDLPAGFDPAKYDAADIWCRAFRVQFNKASLS